MKQTGRLSFQSVDVADLSEMEGRFGTSSFMAVVDKACLDSMLSGSPGTAEATCRVVSDMLDDGGTFICISHANPDTELGQFLLQEIMLQNFNTLDYRWNVGVHSSAEADDFVHVYVLQKIRRARTRLNSARGNSPNDHGNIDVTRFYH